MSCPNEGNMRYLYYLKLTSKLIMYETKINNEFNAISVATNCIVVEKQSCNITSHPSINEST